MIALVEPQSTKWRLRRAFPPRRSPTCTSRCSSSPSRSRHRAAAGRGARPAGGSAGDDRRTRPHAVLRSRPRGHARALPQPQAAARRGQADDRLRRRLQEVLRDQPLQARLLRSRGHDLLARSAVEAEGAPWTSVCMGDSGGPLVSGGKLVGVTSWSEWCGLRHDPSVFARVSKLRDFIAAPVWAPYSPDAPVVRVEGRRLTCVAPAFEGAAEVTGAIWSRIGLEAPAAEGDRAHVRRSGRRPSTRARSGRATRAAPRGRATPLR